ncbi:hypothetical protein N7468_008798 [Penicillium chermesinum]|uniref:WW domain-containing protein n=1 Tax=Penicillium chermesinum TaxID=63820 RepID=A0A9W9NJ59_9EURO|nr:uncharacterized protein N7468_008798 [Penicillium chermesinum]KAJ5219594.1 hypothetical protein N7468_008798 [Penicillium chermesinum]
MAVPHHLNSGPLQAPPPPLPQGWIQEWEPSTRRAFFVDTNSGRSQWEPPYGPPAGGGYYAPPPGPPGYGGGYQQTVVVEEQRNDSGGGSSAGKMMAAGVGGLAVGALAGGFIEHEIDENNEEDEREAYEDGREDQYEDDGGW